MITVQDTTALADVRPLGEGFLNHRTTGGTFLTAEMGSDRDRQFPKELGIVFQLLPERAQLASLIDLASRWFLTMFFT